MPHTDDLIGFTGLSIQRRETKTAGILQDSRHRVQRETGERKSDGVGQNGGGQGGAISE